MTNKSRFLAFFGLAAVLLLTGCMSREQADAKLSTACGAAVGAMLPEGSRIDSVKAFHGEPSGEGPGLRHMTITAMYMDGWIEQENEYECVFEESFGFASMSYTASIYQVRWDGEMIGKSGGEIVGDAEDFIKLTDAVRKSLYGN